MTTPITIESFDIQGFRAYLQLQTFSLRKGNKPASLAIFAPNAKGKSSLVDAFEYYFSQNATLQRLGLRASQTQTGPAALEHVDAQEHGVTPKVAFNFRQGPDRFGASRLTERGHPVTEAGEQVLSVTKVPFIIHGYELRGFVESTAETRYQEIVSWFSLDPLLVIQRNLRSLQRQTKAKVDSNTESDERIRDLKRVTSNAVSIWDESAVRDWFNVDILAKLDPSLALTEINGSDPTYVVLTQRKAEEEKRIGITALKTLLSQIDALVPGLTDSTEASPGLVVELERAVDDLGLALERENSERDRASQSVFNDLWSQARIIFDLENQELISCPVCDTKFESTPYGSRDAVQVSINAKLSQLEDYRRAESAVQTANNQVSKNKQNLTTALQNLRTGLSDANFEAAAAPVDAYLSSLTSWKPDITLPDSELLSLAMVDARKSLTSALEQLENQQGENT